MPEAKTRLQRLGNRLLCPSCLKALETAPRAVDAGPGAGTEGLRDLLRREVLATVLGLAAKVTLFGTFFLWARTSPLGAAALRGAVAADAFTWLVFSALAWPLRRIRVTAGAVFEALLLLCYWNRGEIFDITAETIEETAFVAVFFFAVVFAKAAAWAAEHALVISGVQEPSSP
jgi:hypothetical protein